MSSLDILKSFKNKPKVDKTDVLTNIQIPSEKSKIKEDSNKVAKLIGAISSLSMVANMSYHAVLGIQSQVESQKVTEYINNNYHHGSQEKIVQQNKIDTQKIHDTMKSCNIARSQMPSNSSDIERVDKEKLNVISTAVQDKIRSLTFIEVQGETANMMPPGLQEVSQSDTQNKTLKDAQFQQAMDKLVALQQKTGIQLTATTIEDASKTANNKQVSVDKFYQMLENNFNVALAFNVENRYTTFNIADLDKLTGGSHTSDMNLGKSNHKHASINISPNYVNISTNIHEIVGHLDSDIQSPDANMCLLLSQMQAGGANYDQSTELLNELANYEAPSLTQKDINQEEFLKDPKVEYQKAIRNKVFYNDPKAKEYDANTVPEKLKKFGVEPYQYNNIFILNTTKGVNEAAKELLKSNEENPVVTERLNKIIKENSVFSPTPKLFNTASFPEIESVATERLVRFGNGLPSPEKSLLYYNVMLKIAAKTNNGAYLDLRYFELLAKFNMDPSSTNTDKMNQYLKQHAKPLIVNEVMTIDSQYIKDLQNTDRRG